MVFDFSQTSSLYPLSSDSDSDLDQSSFFAVDYEELFRPSISTNSRSMKRSKSSWIEQTKNSPSLLPSIKPTSMKLKRKNSIGNTWMDWSSVTSTAHSDRQHEPCVLDRAEDLTAAMGFVNPCLSDNYEWEDAREREKQDDCISPLLFSSFPCIRSHETLRKTDRGELVVLQSSSKYFDEGRTNIFSQNRKIDRSPIYDIRLCIITIIALKKKRRGKKSDFIE